MRILLILLILSCPFLSIGQGSLTLEDYQRAVSYLPNQVINKRAFNLNIQPQWFKDESGMWFIKRAAEHKTFVKVSLPDMVVSDLFDHQRMATELGAVLEDDLSAQDLPLEQLDTEDGSIFSFRSKGKNFEIDIRDYSIKEKKEPQNRSRFESDSPDTSWTAFVEDFNLMVRSGNDGITKQLSKDGREKFEYATWYGWADIMEGEGGTRPERFFVNWSPDSEWLFTNICDFDSADKMYLLDWSIDSMYRPKLLSYYRGSPGDSTMVYVHPVFYHPKTGREVRPNLPKTTHINTVGMRWAADESKAYLMYRARGFQTITIYEFDLDKATLDTVYTETSKTNIDNFSWEWTSEQDKFFFLSEKSGWRQLYSYDAGSRRENRLTLGDFYVHNIIHLDEENEWVYYVASGNEEGSNPYHRFLYRISFNGGLPELLTPEPTNHQVYLSPSGRFFVDNRSSVTRETSTYLVQIDENRTSIPLSKADVAELGGWKTPQTFTTKARDGKTTIYGALWKPTQFDARKKYPIIDASYTGPHTQRFPREFRQAVLTSNQSLAELGFVVVQIDGLGSSGRSKEFHDYSYKNLGGNLEDHVLAMRHLGSEYPWVDTTRVGIFGHSAGGYDAAHALLQFPDFYKVAVSSSADHDHRMEKAWWPEMYMGWPVDSAYHNQSNITMAKNLKGKLLITHGGIDENVNPSATFKLAEALIRVDKQFDMLILPSQRHGYRGKHGQYFTKLRWNYFVKHLHGIEPIWDFSME